MLYTEQLPVQGDAEANDFDDFIDQVSTPYGLNTVRREYKIKAPLRKLVEVFYDNPRLLEVTGFSTMDDFLVPLNESYTTKEYLNMPLRQSYIDGLKAAAKRKPQAILTSRPVAYADAFLEKLDRNGVLPLLQAGVHHVPKGETKLTVCQREGFVKLRDDHPRHVFHVASGGLQAIGVIGHRPWNTRAHYMRMFNGQIPPNVQLVGSFHQAISR